MIDLIEGSGIFVYPLGLCSFLAVFIFVERLIALRTSKVIPREFTEGFIRGELPEQGSSNSVAGRILEFFYQRDPDPEQLQAFARLEVIRMERGLFILEIVVSAAPLIGLLGTVTGLVKVFAQISPETGMPDPGAFVEGVALALTTTMIGLTIAIPALVASSYLNRRVDMLAAQLNVGVERLTEYSRQKHPVEPSTLPADSRQTGTATVQEESAALKTERRRKATHSADADKETTGDSTASSSSANYSAI